MNTWKVHNVHNSYIDNIGIPKHTKNNWRLLSSGTKLFITFDLKTFFRHKERERHILSMLTFPSPPPHHHHHHVRHPPQGLGELRKSTFFFRGKNSTDFFLFPKILRARFRCMTSFTSRGQVFYLGFLLWHLWMTRPLRARVNTCAHVCI